MGTAKARDYCRREGPAFEYGTQRTACAIDDKDKGISEFDDPAFDDPAVNKV